MNANDPVSLLEKLDETLCGLWAALDLMRLGCPDKISGDKMQSVLGHIGAAVLETRAQLDDATVAVIVGRGADAPAD